MAGLRVSMSDTVQKNVICRKHSCGERCCAVATYDLNFKWSCNECILFVKGLRIFFSMERGTTSLIRVVCPRARAGSRSSLVWVHGFSLVDDPCIIFPLVSQHLSLHWEYSTVTHVEYFLSCLWTCLWRLPRLSMCFQRQASVKGRMTSVCHHSQESSGLRKVCRPSLVPGVCFKMYLFYFLSYTLLPKKNKQQISGKIWTPLTSTSFYWVKLETEIVKFLDARFFFKAASVGTPEQWKQLQHLTPACQSPIRS